MTVVANETKPSKPYPKMFILVASVVFFLGLGIFFWWYDFGGKLDSNISSEDLQEINSMLYTNLEDTSNVVEYFHQNQMMAGTCYSVYIKNVGNYQDFLDDYTTISNSETFTDSKTISDDLHYLHSYFYFTKDKSLSLDTFSPHTLVKAPTSSNDYNDIRLWFFTEDDSSQSVIINVIYGG